MSALSLFIVTSTAVIFICKIILWFLRKIPFYKESRRYPGPPALPFIGNAHYFLGDTKDYLKTCQKLIDTYPTPFRLWLGDQFFYVINDVEHIKIILNSRKALDKANVLKFAKPWLGSGLLMAPASKWQIHRKLINPTFNIRILESFVEIFVRQSDIMIKKMEVELNGGAFEIFDYISLCTLDFIFESAMGHSVHAQTENALYVQAVKQLLEIIHTRICNLWMHPDIIFNNTRLGRDHKKLINFLHTFTDDVIRKKRKGLLINNNGNSEDKKTFLDLLMNLTDNEAKLTNKDLREEVENMIIAGNDTTATANCFILLMLANHPEVQKKVFNELCEIYGTDDPCSKKITHEDLNRMEYLECVIKETLRLFPIGPIIMRQLSDNLNIGNHNLLKGSGVVIGIMGVHRDERYWDDPLKFNPDRFLPENFTRRQSGSFMPFSSGLRNCIGFKYAMMSMKTLITTVVRKYIIKNDTIIPIADMQLKIDLILKTVNPITIKIEKRNYQENQIN